MVAVILLCCLGSLVACTDARGLRMESGTTGSADDVGVGSDDGPVNVVDVPMPGLRRILLSSPDLSMRTKRTIVQCHKCLEIADRLKLIPNRPGQRVLYLVSPNDDSPYQSFLIGDVGYGPTLMMTHEHLAHWLSPAGGKRRWQMVMTSLEYEPGDPRNSPSALVQTWYRWNGEEMEQVKQKTQIYHG